MYGIWGFEKVCDWPFDKCKDYWSKRESLYINKKVTLKSVTFSKAHIVDLRFAAMAVLVFFTATAGTGVIAANLRTHFHGFLFDGNVACYIA